MIDSLRAPRSRWCLKIRKESQPSADMKAFSNVAKFSQEEIFIFVIFNLKHKFSCVTTEGVHILIKSLFEFKAIKIKFRKTLFSQKFVDILDAIK